MLLPEDDTAGRGTEHTFWRFGDNVSCDRAVAAKLANEDFLGILAVWENGGLGFWRMDTGLSA